MSSIIIDKRYGVVQWVPKEETLNYKPRYNSISLHGFFDNQQKNTKINPNDLVIGNLYKAYFWENADSSDHPPSDQKYKAKLIFIGTKLECENKIDSLLKSCQMNSNYIEQQTSPLNNHTINSNNKSRFSKEFTNLESSINHDILVNENRYLKKRLAENLIELANKDETITRLQFEIENLKKMQKYDNLKEFCSADKLMDLATFIFSNFSNSSDMNRFQQEINSNDVENSNNEECIDSNEDFVDYRGDDNQVMVPICDNPKYADHKMRASTKAYIESLSTKVNRNNKRAESSYVFRKILNAALEDEIWAELGTEGVFKLHRVKLEACKILMHSLRSDYSDPEMTSSIRSKCSDVKKQFGLRSGKRSLAQTDTTGASTSFGFKKRSNVVSSNGFPNTESFYMNEMKNESSSYNAINSELLDESSSEYFQDMDSTVLQTFN